MLYFFFVFYVGRLRRPPTWEIDAVEFGERHVMLVRTKPPAIPHHIITRPPSSLPPSSPLNLPASLPFLSSETSTTYVRSIGTDRRRRHRQEQAYRPAGAVDDGGAEEDQGVGAAPRPRQGRQGTSRGCLCACVVDVGFLLLLVGCWRRCGAVRQKKLPHKRRQLLPTAFAPSRIRRRRGNNEIVLALWQSSTDRLPFFSCGRK